MDPLYLTSLSSLDFFFGYHAISSWDARPKNNMSLVAFQNFFGGNRRPKQQVDSWGIVIYDLI